MQITKYHKNKRKEKYLKPLCTFAVRMLLDCCFFLICLFCFVINVMLFILRHLGFDQTRILEETEALVRSIYSCAKSKRPIEKIE